MSLFERHRLAANGAAVPRLEEDLLLNISGNGWAATHGFLQGLTIAGLKNGSFATGRKERGFRGR